MKITKSNLFFRKFYLRKKIFISDSKTKKLKWKLKILICFLIEFHFWIKNNYFLFYFYFSIEKIKKQIKNFSFQIKIIKIHCFSKSLCSNARVIPFFPMCPPADSLSGFWVAKPGAVHTWNIMRGAIIFIFITLYFSAAMEAPSETPSTIVKWKF